ncbi:ADP-ribosylglycohydrolase [Paraphaeosphaeria sporulosa]|uniref:ADP-ribosylhydrolase ARH3 n=1 Tax=Paraphaeosphaeria sporulosa TaxID=1460663 RepID=A0A177CIM2_9PLEO|nr:ADP-ribosylglycohydrolase [Paraphaeosphaeria sporulosa]OAG06699.1 ADP-ribosylglycohydrolase [Paraphaeosphaeria sporulosa]
MAIPAQPASARLSKTLGALLGVHAGDSLGATLEFDSWREIKKNFPNGLRDIIGGGTFGWPAGHATDDTDLTRAVLLAYHDRANHKLLKNPDKEFDIARAAADWSLDWYDGNWPGRKKGQPPRDIGGATRVGLLNYSDLRDPRKCGAGHGSAGNGSLMRCIPTGLFTHDRVDRIKESKEISAITHNDNRCVVSCAAYNEIVAALLDGKTAQAAVGIGIEVALEEDHHAVAKAIERGRTMSISRIVSDGPSDELPDMTSGYVLQSLTVAISALLDPRSLEDVLVDVIRIGGDTDTNGAISGGLLGARDGLEAIPDRWLGTLQFRAEFEELARDILDLESSPSKILSVSYKKRHGLS